MRILMAAILAASLGLGCGDGDGQDAGASSAAVKQDADNEKANHSPKKAATGDDAMPAKPATTQAADPRPGTAPQESPELEEPGDLDEPKDPAGGNADGDCYGADQFICDIERAITRYTNERRPAGTPLAHHDRLAFVARDWSEKQQASGRISHTGFPGARASLYLSEFGTNDVEIYAENVAYSYSSEDSADDVAKMFVDMWWNSSGHRRNMLGNYEVLGSGVARSGDTFYATQIFGETDD